MRRAWIILLLTFAVVAVVGGGYFAYDKKTGGRLSSQMPKDEPLEPVRSVTAAKAEYDVIVVGTDPEGVMAAVSSARNGLNTLLVEPRYSRNVLGGLMTEGWLNSVDMNWDSLSKSLLPGKPDPLNTGLFTEWYGMIEGDSFDVETAANAFYKMVKDEEKIDVLMKTKGVGPLLEEGQDAPVLKGVEIVKGDGSREKVRAKVVIDATQDAEVAYAAGVPFTVGREDEGDKLTSMGVTLCFKISGISDKEWAKIRSGLDNDGDSGTGSTETSAYGWGPLFKEKYKPLDAKRVRVRGPNVGRQNDDSVLINNVVIFNVDPFNPESVKEAMDIGKREIPRVVQFMKENIPGFENARLAGTASELYVRETRHMKALYRLSIIDLLENRDQWDRVSLGSYPADVQAASPTDWGMVWVEPTQYAVPFRSLVPPNVDGLLVVGRSAGYDTKPHGSARVIPVGMDEGQSAGIAARVVIDAGTTFRKMAESKELIGKLHDKAIKQGMNLKPFKVPDQEYMNHKYYAGLKLALYHGMIALGYGNQYHTDIDLPSNPQRVANHMKSLRRYYSAANPVFKGDPEAGLKGLTDDEKKAELTLDRASYIIGISFGMNVTPENARSVLTERGMFLPETVEGIADKNKVTNGEVWMMLRDVLQRTVGVKF